MIGNTYEKLPAFVSHYRPRLIAYADETSAAAKEPTVHPYEWPTKTIPPQELEAIFYGEQKSC